MQEGILRFSQIELRSEGIGESGPVYLNGSLTKSGTLERLQIEAFDKNFTCPEELLAKLPKMINGVLLSYVFDIRSGKGKTLYMTFQFGFTSGIKEKVILSLNEQGEFSIIEG